MMQLIQRAQRCLNYWASHIFMNFAGPIDTTEHDDFPSHSGSTGNDGTRKRRETLLVLMMVIAAAVVTWVAIIGLDDEFASTVTPTEKGSCWDKLPIAMLAGFGGIILTAIQSMFWRKTVRPLWLPLTGGVSSGVLVILTYYSCWPATSSGLLICVTAYSAAIAIFVRIRNTPT